MTGPIATVSLGINLEETFERERAIDLADACKLIKGRKGRLHVDVARRWAKRGCRPAGEDGPRLLLPTVRLGGVRWTMPDWVAAFEKMRLRIAMQAVRPEVQGRSKREARRAYEEACKALP